MSKYVSSLDICRFWVYFVSRRDCLRETDLAFSEKYNWQGCCTWYYHRTHLNCPDDSIEHQTANQGHGFDPRLRQSCCLRQKYPLPHWPVTCRGSVSSALWHPGTYDHHIITIEIKQKWNKPMAQASSTIHHILHAQSLTMNRTVEHGMSTCLMPTLSVAKRFINLWTSKLSIKYTKMSVKWKEIERKYLWRQYLEISL